MRSYFKNSKESLSDRDNSNNNKKTWTKEVMMFTSIELAHYMNLNALLMFHMFMFLDVLFFLLTAEC